MDEYLCQSGTLQSVLQGLGQWRISATYNAEIAFILSCVVHIGSCIWTEYLSNICLYLDISFQV